MSAPAMALPSPNSTPTASSAADAPTPAPRAADDDAAPHDPSPPSPVAAAKSAGTGDGATSDTSPAAGNGAAGTATPTDGSGTGAGAGARAGAGAGGGPAAAAAPPPPAAAEAAALSPVSVDDGDTHPFADLLLEVETDPSLMGELESLEKEVEKDTLSRMVAAEEAVSQLRQEILRKDAQVRRYVATRRKIDAKRAAELAAVRQELEAYKARHPAPAPVAAPAPEPMDLAARFRRLPGANSPAAGVSLPSPAPSGLSTPSTTADSTAHQLQAVKDEVVRGEGVIGQSIQWAAAQPDATFNMRAKAIVKPILSWYLKLREVMGE